jgi:tyrosyl-tRNA synthetase
LVALLRELGFAASGNEARRKVQEGAVRVGGMVVSDPAMLVSVTVEPVPIQLGAKRHGLAVAP